MIEADPPLSFIDSNIIIYALARDDSARSPVAAALIDTLGRAKALCVSTQVLQESFVTLTRKGARVLPPREALEALDKIAEFPTVTIDYKLIRRAAEVSAAHTLSFWDALIIVSAARAGAQRLYTEDLQHGRVLLGVEIVNPFLGA